MTPSLPALDAIARRRATRHFDPAKPLAEDLLKTILGAAESLGVASAPMEGFDPVREKEAFGVPGDHTVCCLVAPGHASKPQASPGRFGSSDVCYEEQFGQAWTLGE